MNIAFALRQDSSIPMSKIFGVLDQHQIEYRPIIAGNLARHPVAKSLELRQGQTLETANYLLERGFMIGCPIDLNENQKSAILQTKEKLAQL